MLVDLISYVLGYRGVEDVDNTIKAMLSIFSPGKAPAVHYDYATYIAEKIHEQLMNLQRERVFRYTSYIYHLFLFYQPDSFSIPLKKRIHRPVHSPSYDIVVWCPSSKANR